MPCAAPLSGYRSRTVNKATGLRSLVFNPNEGYRDMMVPTPCGQCVFCRLERARQWAIRCMHEASLYGDNNLFVTLTYADEHLPMMSLLETRQIRTTLVKKHFQDFMKRLRIKFAHERRNVYGIVQKDIRFYMCGEYGEENDRPHYHAILFNLCLPDLWEWKTHRGFKYYRSPTLESLWTFGHSVVGEVNFETANYVARYVLKKQVGKAALDHYCTQDAQGEILFDRLPEYNDMSRRGGIGKPWFEKFKSDVYPADLVISRGREMRPPKAYDLWYAKENPEEMREIKLKRVEVAKTFAHDNNMFRMAVRERKKLLSLKQLLRGYESYET